MSATVPNFDLDERIARIRRRQVALDGFVTDPEPGGGDDRGLVPASIVACCALLAGLGALLVLAY